MGCLRGTDPHVHRAHSGEDAAGAGPAGLVAAYGFDEGTGATTGDGTGNTHTGTIAGATWTAAGKNGGALSFNGNGDWVTVADANDLDLTTGMTLEAWVYPTTTNSVWRTVIAKELGGDLAYAMQANSSAGRPYALANTGGEQLAQGSAGLAVNTWSHLTATYDGTAVRLYVNGVLSGTKATTGNIVTPASRSTSEGTQGWANGSRAAWTTSASTTAPCRPRRSRPT